MGWGYYRRWAIDADGMFRILIKVWKCRRQAAGGYLSVQPTFLLPYRQHTLLIIYRILCLRLLAGTTLRNSWQWVMGGTRCMRQTVQHWVKALPAQCDFWSGIMQGEAGLVPLADNVSGVVRMLTIMDQYLGGATDEADREARHAALLNRYRGSPLCRRRYS